MDDLELPEKSPDRTQTENNQRIKEVLGENRQAFEMLIEKSHRDGNVQATADIRALRNRIVDLLKRIDGKTTAFSGKTASSLDEFYDAEQQLIAKSDSFSEMISQMLDGEMNIEAFKLTMSLESIERAIKARIPVDPVLMGKYSANRQRIAAEKAASSEPEVIEESLAIKDEPEQPEEYSVQQPVRETVEEKLDTETLSVLYNYLNILERKYGDFVPEVSPSGDYLSSPKWKYSTDQRSAHAELKGGIFGSLLVLDARWNPETDLRKLVEKVQGIARAAGNNEYRGICFIANSWDDDISEWAESYTHPRLSLFLYSLGSDGVIYNSENTYSRYLQFWYSPLASGKVRLKDLVLDLLQERVNIDASDLASETGLNKKGAQKLLDKLEKKEMLVDIGFGSSKYALSNTFKDN
ncbi:hypothetical protein J2755_000236 [Methanohalophilus levihalophilus]|uniref:hypothetical protein n=1 Tax=Methanohalophilus levihalophilus TaxID=1431282 RepID=UPI001AE9E450|nr:hypothetical protein [Methanohalophilus levihalophilus]MBP2029316.1 hypothetical protein [Methanohalophilus levihalophilus]